MSSRQVTAIHQIATVTYSANFYATFMLFHMFHYELMKS